VALDANLRRLDQVLTLHPRLQAQVHTTVQAYNILRITELLDYLARSSEPPAALIPALRSLVDYMYAADKSALFPRFAEITRFFDLSRGESILNVLPEFGPYLDEAPGRAISSSRDLRSARS
jgi:hypothetical protein